MEKRIVKMGRPRKVVVQADEDSVTYVLSALKDLKDKRLRCAIFEGRRRTFMEKLGIDPKNYTAGTEPDITVFLRFPNGEQNKDDLYRYLFEKEQIYLMDTGFALLPDGRMKQVAEDMLLHGMKRRDVVKKYGISPATADRDRKEAIMHIAVHVDCYMTRKTEELFL